MDCSFHNGRPATENLTEEPGKVLPVCDECFKRFVGAVTICAKCEVRVISMEDPRAKYNSAPHKPGCPRWVEPPEADRKR